jgi:hypothetical protein
VKLLINEHIQCTAGGGEPGGPDTANQGQVKILITEKEPPFVEVRPDDQVSVV